MSTALNLYVTFLARVILESKIIVSDLPVEVTVKVFSTGGAADQLMPESVPPGWVAVIVTVPVPTIERVDPLTVATFWSELVNVMGSPDVALADRLMLETDMFTSAISAKVMV